MKKLALILPLLATVAACNKANFGAKSEKRKDGGVIAAGSPDGTPLDVSQIGANKGINGPVSGDGERYHKVIELDCEEEGGAFMDIGDLGGGKGKAALKLQDLGEEPIPGAGEDDKDSLENEEDPASGGETADDADDGKIELDTDGKPKGGKLPDKGGKGGKGGKGKGEVPELPKEETPKNSHVTAKVKGKFCPTSKKKLTVLFVVDFSGSMGRHIPTNKPGWKGEHPGNDPQIAGSCGRLRAAQAILDRIEHERLPGDQIRIGMIPFAGGIVTNKVLGITSFEKFKALVSKDTFCQYVVQGPSFGYDPVNPGGINGGPVDSSTNYRAAFQAAETVLSHIYGRKVVYFISDGEPTSGGIDPVAAGIEAGERLRASVDNLTLNALLLGNPGPHAKQVLDLVAGSPSRVRHAEDADELARKILDFPVATIDPATATATLTVEPYPRASLDFLFFDEEPNGSGVWVYETKPFVLLGKPGEEVLNLVEITAFGSDGSTHKAVVEIYYRL